GELAMKLFVRGCECLDHPSGRAENQAARRNFGARGDQRARTNHAALADLGSVEHGRLNANQAAATDPTAVQDGSMTDDDLLADDRRVEIAEVNDGAVLDVGALVDLDAVDVGTQHAAVPDADVVV